MATATAPTEAEIREAVDGAWNDWRMDAPWWDKAPCSGKFTDLILGDAAWHAWSLLYRPLGDASAKAKHWDRIVDENLVPLMAEFEARITAALTAALTQFAEEFPESSRTRNPGRVPHPETRIAS